MHVLRKISLFGALISLILLTRPSLAELNYSKSFFIKSDAHPRQTYHLAIEDVSETTPAGEETHSESEDESNRKKKRVTTRLPDRTTINYSIIYQQSESHPHQVLLEFGDGQMPVSGVDIQQLILDGATNLSQYYGSFIVLCELPSAQTSGEHPLTVSPYFVLQTASLENGIFTLEVGPLAHSVTGLGTSSGSIQISQSGQFIQMSGTLLTGNSFQLWPAVFADPEFPAYSNRAFIQNFTISISEKLLTAASCNREIWLKPLFTAVTQ